MANHVEQLYAKFLRAIDKAGAVSDSPMAILIGGPAHGKEAFVCAGISYPRTTETGAVEVNAYRFLKRGDGQWLGVHESLSGTDGIVRSLQECPMPGVASLTTELFARIAEMQLRAGCAAFGLDPAECESDLILSFAETVCSSMKALDFAVPSVDELATRIQARLHRRTYQ